MINITYIYFNYIILFVILISEVMYMNKNMINPAKLLSGQTTQDECFHPVVTVSCGEEPYYGENYTCAICDLKFNTYYIKNDFCRDPHIIGTLLYEEEQRMIIKRFIQIICEKYKNADEINITELVKLIDADIRKVSDNYTWALMNAKRENISATDEAIKKMKRFE